MAHQTYDKNIGKNKNIYQNKNKNMYQTHDKNICEAKLEASSCAREGGPPVLAFQDVWVKPGDDQHDGDGDDAGLKY